MGTMCGSVQPVVTKVDKNGRYDPSDGWIPRQHEHAIMLVDVHISDGDGTLSEKAVKIKREPNFRLPLPKRFPFISVRVQYRIDQRATQLHHWGRII